MHFCPICFLDAAVRLVLRFHGGGDAGNTGVPF
jgi:hypothetical protein